MHTQSAENKQQQPKQVDEHNALTVLTVSRSNGIAVDVYRREVGHLRAVGTTVISPSFCCPSSDPRPAPPTTLQWLPGAS